MSNSNRDVAHLWANQSKSRARSSNGNFHFDGPVLYSYSTPIAVMHPQAILVTSKSYSMTTEGKHKNAMRHAIDYDRRRVFVVPDLGDYGTIDHPANMRYLREQVDVWAATHLRSFTRAEFYLDRLRSAIDNYNNYAAAFGLSNRIPAHVLETIEAERRQIEAERNTPERIAKREAAQAKAEERKARQAALALQKERERAAQWLAGENVQYHTPYGRAALLRIKGDTLETSQGARVPLEDAKRVFSFVARVRANGTPWVGSMGVGDFHVDRISATGDMHAGCHLIVWDEMQRLATSIGFKV